MIFEFRSSINILEQTNRISTLLNERKILNRVLLKQIKCRMQRGRIDADAEAPRTSEHSEGVQWSTSFSPASHTQNLPGITEITSAKLTLRTSPTRLDRRKAAFS